MSSEEKTPYYSVTASVSQMTTQKQLGLHYIKVEATFGNRKSIVIRNETDLAEIKDNISLATALWDAYREVKKTGEDRGHKFIEVEN